MKNIAIKVYDPEAREVRKIDGRWKPVTVRKLIDTKCFRSTDKDLMEEELAFLHSEGFETEIVDDDPECR